MRPILVRLTLVACLMTPSIAGAVPWAYITNYGDDTVSVLDTSSNAVVAIIPVASSPYAVTVNPAGTRVYITHDNGGGISVLDTATNAGVGFIGPGARGVAITPDGTRLYVPNYPAATVSVVDTTTNEEVGDPIEVGDQPVGLAVTPDGTRVYVANQGTGLSTVSVIDTAMNTVVDTVPVGEGPVGVTVTPDGLAVYVTNSFESDPGTVSVISTLSNTVVATIPVGPEPQGITVSPNGMWVYVANTDQSSSEDEDTVSVIDTMTNTVIATIAVDSQPLGIAVTPDGARVYVANSAGGLVGDANTVSVIDAATNTVIATLGGFNSPFAFGPFIGGACPAIPFACTTTGVVPPDLPTRRCEDRATNATLTLVRKIVRCHIVNARRERKQTDFDEDACDIAATGLLDTKVQALSGCPACLDSLAVGQRLRQVFDQLNGPIYCAGTDEFASGDPGFVPPDANTERCAARISRAIVALSVGTVRCNKRQVAAAFRGASFDALRCAAAVSDRYTAASAALEAMGTCPTCVSASARLALGQQVRAIMDGSNALTYCANCIDDTQCPAPQTCGGGSVGNVCGGP